MIQVPLSPEQYSELAAKMAKEEGVTVNGESGKISKMGVSADFVYSNGVFTVNVLDKPFFVTTEYCEEQIKKAMGLPN